MDKNYLVTKSNYFIMHSNYDLSLEEQKLILTLASMVQPQDQEFKPYIFKINEFMRLLGVNTKTKYAEVPRITKELMKKVFEIQEENKIIQVAWLSSVEYEKGSGLVELQFSPKLKPYMLQLNKLYTSYKLANILEMKSKYSPRIYEFLKCNQFKKQGYIEIEIQELKKLLKADDVYVRYNDFKRKVILQAQKEINALTDINFNYEEIKTGRKVTSIKFYIKPNKKSNIEDKNEIALGKVEEDPENLNLIKQVQKIFTKHKIKEHEAKCMLKDSNNNLELINKCYRYALSKNINENFVGYIRTILKNFHEPQKNIKTSTFNDYEQRNYDFDALEKKLLGWDSSSESEEEFNMADFISS